MNPKQKKRKRPVSTVLIMICLSVIASYYGKDKLTDTFQSESSVTISEAKGNVIVPLASDSHLSPTKNQLLLPSFLTDRAEEIVWHDGFVLSYNRKHLLPNWVSWLLTKERTRGKEKRADNFQPDMDIHKGPLAEDKDYRGTGYDRGHMCPSADCKHTRNSQNQCFLMSNICPQTHTLNAGDWKELEEMTRKWAQRYDSLYIVCGPVLKKGKTYPTIGENKVSVPELYFKVIWRNISDRKAEAIGFVFKNDDTNKPLSEYVLSVDEIEEITGINFFCKFPKELERMAESSVDINAWYNLK